jgi:hypothetical protein
MEATRTKPEPHQPVEPAALGFWCRFSLTSAGPQPFTRATTPALFPRLPNLSPLTRPEFHQPVEPGPGGAYHRTRPVSSTTQRPPRIAVLVLAPSWARTDESRPTLKITTYFPPPFGDGEEDARPLHPGHRPVAQH